MNILIDVRSIMDDNYSGVGEYTFNLLNNLFKIDNKNQYFLFYNNFSKVIMPNWHEQYNNVKLCGFNYPNKLINTSFKLTNYPKISNLIKQKIDLTFIPNINFLSLNSKEKTILTIHDLSFELYPSFFSIKRRLWHKIVNPQKLCSCADEIIAVSNNTKKDLINKYKLPENKITVIYPGVTKNFFQTPLQEKSNIIKEKYKLPEKFILFLGTIEPRKNIIGLIDSYELLRDKYNHNIPLVLAGGKGWLVKKIYKRANKCKYKKDIIFLDYVLKEEKKYLYDLATLFVFPSFYEGFGFPPLEALACNTPVINSYTGSLCEIMKNKSLMVDPYDVNQLTFLMHQALLSNNNVLNKKVDKELYSWKKTAFQTLELFNKML